MGQSAQLFLAKGPPNDISTLVEKICLLACLGVANEKYRPITQAGVEQIARLTLALLLLKNRNIKFAARQLSQNLSLVAKLFLQLPEPPLSGLHSTYLGPYYSSTKADALPIWMTNLAKHVLEADEDDEATKNIIRNVEEWADGSYVQQKELLLLAIKRKSNFTFDIIHWITHVGKMLFAISNAPACDELRGKKLREHSVWLIGVLSWIPKDHETISFVENWSMTEALFDVAREAYVRKCEEILEELQNILLGWAFKAARHQSGTNVFVRSLCGLAVLALMDDSGAEVELLKENVNKRLSLLEAPAKELRDVAARNIRRRAATPSRYSYDVIDNAMSAVDWGQLSPVLEDLANILSPDTKDEQPPVAIF